MPITRFEIRNEYGLADPELYRAADKDDPEALLEGVAMAGLVGVLRQLGDLAEFAAEIFHNLHEEVMVTAARGHSLMIRVQQLEADVPSIERAFLSQTDHSSCFYHTGADWHPNLRIETNPVTQGDIPRFVMDSYEECRAPPRLFLLDKFDVAGAGACLKRYTDPSFFKSEIRDMTTGDVQREKKILKLKKKGPRGRNGETAEVVQTSHAKLHQLFLEERTENGVNNHSRHVKLKRRLSGYPFDSKFGKSYMEKILKSPSPDHKVLHEVDVNSLSPLMPARSDENEFGPEALEVRSFSPDRGYAVIERSSNSPLDRKEILLSPSLYEPAEVTTDDQISMIPNSYHSFAAGGTSSTLDKMTAEKVIAVDEENNSDGCPTDFETNVGASEVENYVDATSTMETEMDREDESGMKNDFTAPRIESQLLISDSNEEHHPTWILDSQSSGGSMISDEGNHSSTKEMSVCSSSESPSASAENPKSERSVNRSSSVDTAEIEIVATSSNQNNADDGFSVDQHSRSVVCDDICISTDAINHHASDFEQLTSPCSDESIPTSVHSESVGIMTGSKSKQQEYDGTSSTSDDDEKVINLVTNQLHAGDNSADLSAGQHLVNEPTGTSVLFTSTVPDISCPITDGSATSLDVLPEDEAYREEHLAENIASTSSMFNVLTLSRNDAPEINPTSSPIPGESDVGVPKSPEYLSSNYSDIAHNEDVIELAVSQEESLPSKLDNEDSNASTYASNCASDMIEASCGQKLDETLSVDAQTVAADKCCSNTSTENIWSPEDLIMLHSVNSPDQPQSDLDADEEVVTMGNGAIALESPPSCEVVRLQATRMTDCAFPSDSEALGTSVYTANLEEPGTSNTEEMDGITLSTSSTAQEVTGISGPTDLNAPNQADVLLEVSDSEGEKSDMDMESTACVVSDNTSMDSAHSNEDLKKVVEHVHCPEDSSSDEVENDKCILSGIHGASGVVDEEVDQTKASVSVSEAVLCNSINHDIPNFEVSDVPNSHLELEADARRKSVDTDTILPLLEQNDSGTEHEISHESSLGNNIPAAESFPVDYGTDESITPENIGLAFNEFDQELSRPGNMSFQLRTLLPLTSQQRLDDDHKGDDISVHTFSLDHGTTPPSISELQNQSGYGDGVPDYPQDPLSSIFPPNNPSTEKTKINLVDLPPLPPLPPVQWRMGKFQHDSASLEGEVMELQELSPQAVSQMNASADDVNPFLVDTFADEFKNFPPTASSDGSISLQTASFTDDVNSSQLTPSTDYVSLSLEEATHCPIQTAPKAEQEAKHSFSTLEFKDTRDTIDVIPDIEDEQQQVKQASLEEATQCPSQTSPKTESKEEEAKNSCSSLEIKYKSESIDVVPNIEEKQQQSAIPTPNSEFTSPEGDGLSHGSHMVKLPRPRNPLVEDVAVLDKSKLRKVSERDRPRIQKVDERDAFLEQIRNKSFNLKPTMASRPSIQHPRTNLRVAAILEKANAIRQALADSDEDDDDCWSDS